MTTLRPWKPRYFDIGVNFSDMMFQGCYNGSHTPKHPPDIDRIIKRAHLFNVDKMLITASTIKESEEHFELVSKYPNFFRSTVGVHPCTVAEEFFVANSNGTGFSDQLIPDLQTKLDKLKDLTISGYKQGFVRAFGEIGLDYDRLHFSNKFQQCTMFEKQLEVIASLKQYEIPLFLHMRNATDDFISILKPFLERGDIKKGNGVVHSFTGTAEELKSVLELDFYVSVNGCSLKSEKNLEVAKLIPKNRLMIETDAPWCEIRKSHACYKFISPYPNKFFPLVEQKLLEVEQVPEEPEEKPVVKKKNKANNAKSLAIKFDDFIPFPSIKKENFFKHQDLVSTLKKDLPPALQEVEFDVGELSYPLIKSRNEPVKVGLVAEAMCAIYGVTDEKEIEELLDMVYENSCKLFD